MRALLAALITIYAPAAMAYTCPIHSGWGGQWTGGYMQNYEWNAANGIMTVTLSDGTHHQFVGVAQSVPQKMQSLTPAQTQQFYTSTVHPHHEALLSEGIDNWCAIFNEIGSPILTR